MLFRCIALLLAFAAPPTPENRLVITNECITKIDTDHAYLMGPDLEHMVVYGLKVHYKAGCEHWEVTK